MRIPMLSVVIPSYNEMANLQKGTLEKVASYLKRKKYDYEVIVVDDASTDGSLPFVKNWTKENKNTCLVENNHTGKAGAVTAGMLKAKGKYILFTDMDQATPIEEVEKLLPFIKDKYDVVIGSRRQRQGAPLSRKLMSKATIVLRKVMVGLFAIHDTQCGFKMFRREVAQNLFLDIKKIHHGYKTIKGSAVKAGFDMELLYLANKKGYRIKEVPVSWLYVETRRVSPVKDSIEGVLDLISIRINIINGLYG